LKKNPANANATTPERVQLASATGPGQRLIQSSVRRQPVSISEVRGRIVGIQSKGLFEFGLRLSPLELILQDVAEQDVCFGKLRIQFQRLPHRTNGLWACFVRWSAVEWLAEVFVSVCQTDVSRCKRRVLSDRVFEVGDHSLNLRAGIASGELSLEI